MLLLFTVELPVIDPKNATLLLQQFAQFNPALKHRQGGGYLLAVPSGRVPLRTMRVLKEFCSGQYPHWKWRLLGVDDDGNPTIPISEERA